MSLLTLSVDSFLTLLNVDCVNNLLACLLGDFTGVLLGVLVALLLLLVLTVRTARVSLFSWISRSLVVNTSISSTVSNSSSNTNASGNSSNTSYCSVRLVMSINNLRLAFDDARIVVDLFMFLRTMGDDYVFTLFNVSDIHNNVIVNVAFIVVLLFWSFVTLIVFLIMTDWSMVVSMSKVMTARV